MNTVALSTIGERRYSITVLRAYAETLSGRFEAMATMLRQELDWIEAGIRDYLSHPMSMVLLGAVPELRKQDWSPREHDSSPTMGKVTPSA